MTALVIEQTQPGKDYLKCQGVQVNTVLRLVTQADIVLGSNILNDPADEFHMDEHQVVQVGYQFKDGVTFMTVTSTKQLGACGQL
jgi:hypothetical protein